MTNHINGVETNLVNGLNDDVTVEESMAKRFAALERLQSNKDFQYLILEEYLTKEPLRLTELLAVHSVKVRGERPDIMEKLVAISNFKDYLFTIGIMGAPASEEDEEEQG